MHMAPIGALADLAKAGPTLSERQLLSAPVH